MAYLSEEWCNTCQGQRRHLNNKCCECACRIAREVRTAWENKTLAQKIEELKEKIEELEKIKKHL